MAEPKSNCGNAIARLLAGPRGIVNLGLESFVGPLMPLGVPVVHVEWRPPAGGDLELLRILDAMEEVGPGGGDAGHGARPAVDSKGQ